MQYANANCVQIYKYILKQDAMKKQLLQKKIRSKNIHKASMSSRLLKEFAMVRQRTQY